MALSSSKQGDKDRSERRRRHGPVAAFPMPSPEPFSINHMIRQHPRTRLFVAPIKWTSEQPRLLGCQFVLKPPKKIPRSGNAGQHTKHEHTEHETRHSRRGPTEAASPSTPATIREAAEWAVKCLLRPHDILVGTRYDLIFRFDRRMAIRLGADAVFSRSPSTTIPTVAYLDLRTLNRLRMKRRCRFRPTNKAEDPYIAAMLIALAQGQRHTQGNTAADTVSPSGSTLSGSMLSGSTPSSTSSEAAGTVTEAAICFKVHLLALDTDTSSLYYYAARIPAAFLDRLNMPSRYFPGEPVLISYRCIPLRRLEERVLRSLVRALST
ncbi:hypothetical protein B0T18DRAFT_385850 [Schizothecium vesticola]|uniref:Uncharacterized protein n=1 Tax=Schizothecium vesticola TaxID=314040 RepID=A0AA40F9U5_9PEZI|nr:hypothetical protein B0T18DRAFT_385850 [Schizothecium vesticola]